MDPGKWFPIIIIGMVVVTIIVFAIIMFLDKGDK